MSSYRRLDSSPTGSNVGSGGGSRFRLGLSPSKPAAEQEGKQRENADAREDALAHSFRAEFPSLMSPHKSGFLRLDSNDEEDDSCSAEETEATETKMKKHYLKFLGRARKRIGSPSKSRLLSESSQSSSESKKGDRKKASATGRKGAEEREKNVKVGEKKLTSDRGEESNVDVKSNEDISIEGAAAATEAREDADQVQQVDESAVDELRDGPASEGQIAMQLPCIVRRKEAEEVIRSFDSDNNGTTIDPSVAIPSPAWCSNIQVVDDSLMETGEEQEVEDHALSQKMDDQSATLSSRATGNDSSGF